MLDEFSSTVSTLTRRNIPEPERRRTRTNGSHRGDRHSASMSHLITRVTSHQQKVMNLYKRAYRELEAQTEDRLQFLYEATVLRSEFDKNKNEKDERVAYRLIEKAEDELFKYRMHVPKYFMDSPGGSAYEQGLYTSQDQLLDYWHPMEKALYPKYFARREQRKREYVKLWHKMYNVPEGEVPQAPPQKES